MVPINLKGNRLGLVSTPTPFSRGSCSTEHAVSSLEQIKDLSQRDKPGTMLNPEQLAAYNGKPMAGQSLSMEVEDDENPGQPLVSVNAEVVSDLHIKAVVSNHEDGTTVKTDFKRSTPSSNWNKITVNGHSEFLSNGLDTITPDAPLADFVLALLSFHFALQNISSKLNSMELELRSRNRDMSVAPTVLPTMELAGARMNRLASPTRQLSRTEKRRVLKELGLLRTSTSDPGTSSNPYGDYPISAQTRGRPAGLPAGGAKAPTNQEDDDCCIGQKLTCSFGNELGKHTIRTGLCGSYKVDILECCEKHDIQLFCGDGIDLPEPLSYLTALREIELWLIAIAMQLSLCVSSIVTARLTADWPWYCGSFVIGLLVSAIVGAIVIVSTTVGLWVAPHDLVWGWFKGDPWARKQIALDGDHDHCCLCGGHEVTWCCDWRGSPNAKKCRDDSGKARPLCW